MIATTQQNMTTELQDLGGSGGPPRNWKGIGIAMVVILGVMSLVILAVILLSPDESRLTLLSPLTVEDLETEEFKVHDPCVTWLNENEVALRSRAGHVLKHSLHLNLTSTLLDNSTFDLKAIKFQVSADQKFVLLAYDIHPATGKHLVWTTMEANIGQKVRGVRTRGGPDLQRRQFDDFVVNDMMDKSELKPVRTDNSLVLVFSQSYTASYVVYSVGTGDLSALKPPEMEAAVLQYAAWGPQGNQLAFVYDNNIYYQSEVSSGPLRLTSSGRQGLVVNGVTDWIYGEEVLLTYPAHWWSRDGARLAYLTINNSATPFMEIPHFLGGGYPSNMFYPYPKAGANIPAVGLFVVNLYGPAHTLEMIPPDSFRTRNYYISMVKWISSTRLAVRWLNRPQNQSVLSVCEATTGACSEKHKMAVDVWQDQRQEVPLFSGDGSVFYLTLPAKQGARGEFRHIAALPVQPAVPSVPPRFLTSGNWDVTSLCALDEEQGKIYFLSTEESRQSRHLYSVDVGGVFLRQCLTCNLIEGCSFFKAQFSPNQTQFILHCLGPGIPKVTVHRTNDPYRYTVLEDNWPLSQALEGKRLPEIQFQTLSDVDFDLHLKMALPLGYESNLHPLLLIVDGVPGSQAVTEEFSLGWPEALCSSHGVALAWVDGRNGVARGQKSPALDPRKLGSLAVKDQLGVVEWLMQLPYIDHRRIALYGKAFGGYLTLKMLSATDKLFKCAAVMAPITDFRLYSAAFSERFLGLPAKEESFYTAASVLEEVHRLKDENFLLLHGTADTRVHFQHSAELLSRLVKMEANYSLQLYPDEGHALREESSRQHCQRRLCHFYQACLEYFPYAPEPESPEEDY